MHAQSLSRHVRESHVGVGNRYTLGENANDTTTKTRKIETQPVDPIGSSPNAALEAPPKMEAACSEQEVKIDASLSESPDATDAVQFSSSESSTILSQALEEVIKEEIEDDREINSCEMEISAPSSEPTILGAADAVQFSSFESSMILGQFSEDEITDAIAGDIDSEAFFDSICDF